jgi:hypothetical protein
MFRQKALDTLRAHIDKVFDKQLVIAKDIIQMLELS